MLTRSAWFLVGTLMTGFSGCGDSAKSASTQTSSDPASNDEENPLDDAGEEAPIVPVDGGSPDDEDADTRPPGLEADTYRATCEETCAAQSKCIGLSDVQCAEECSVQAAALSTHACLAEAFDELRCLGALHCDELWAYGTNGRRDHPTCGAQADAYFTACTVGSGKPPAACEAMCARFSGCDALQARTLRACQETCVLRATWAVWTVGVECGDAFLAVAGCVAEASCADVTELQTLGTIPPFCVTLEAARDAACN